MGRKKKPTSAKVLSLLVAVVFCLTVFTVPVSAEGSDGNPKQKDEKTKIDFLDDVDTEEPEPSVVEPEYKYGRWDKVHSNPGTFEKNFILSPEQKEYSIKKYEAVVSAILEPEMSDLEKYYTLAIWLNHHVNYDWLFWPGPYDFDYYSHQWDAYGVLKERKSVCAGIAVAYANICHAADLPCKFIRMKPYYLDHTINYIPDINGHAYYIDVTENLFFMSKAANPWSPMDPAFSDIAEDQLPADGTFEFDGKNGTFMVSKIKEFYGVPFDEWFNEYGLHQNTKKKFSTDYVEDGSGVSSEDPRYRHRSYKDFEHYPAQRYEGTRSGDVTGVWFLDDFYKEPAEAMGMIRNKELNEQFLNISGIKGSYDNYTTAEDLAAAVSGDIAIKYFPSVDENDNVVAKADKLTNDTDYTVTCDPDTFNEETGEATITITGTGKYNGEYRIPVRLNSAAVTKAPVNNMDLDYTGEPQALVTPGTVENGTILYAMYNKSSEDESWKKGDPDAKPYPEPPDNLVYSEEIPTATDAGRYAVWYKVEGDETHSDIEPQRLERAAVILPIKPTITVGDKTIGVGEKIKLAPALDKKVGLNYIFLSFDEDIVKVSKDGILTGVAVGTVKVGIGGKLVKDEPNWGDPEDIEITVTVTKGPNPMKLKSKTAKISRSKLGKKAQKIKSAKLFGVSHAQGKLTYKLASAKNGKKSFKNYFKVDSKTGNVTVKKGLKKGTYKVKVKVKAAGNANYKPSSWKSVTSKVRVK